jgi:NAD-dependent deacetylase
MRPDVVWFGEQLSSEVVDAASRVARESEIMFVVGTSAVVYPAAALPVLTKNSGGVVVELNIEPTDVTSYADASLFGPAGELLPALWNKLERIPKAL